MSLRPYQQECVSAICNYAKGGIREQLVVLPTGCGKTRIIAELPKAIPVPPDKATLFIVQTDEQANQTFRAFRQANPELSVQIEMGDRRADTWADVVIASIQTLSVPGRREKFEPDRFGLIVPDEAHHSVSRTTLDALRYFRALKGEENRNPNVLLVGATATPSRSDCRGLEKVFSKIVYHRSIRQMIEQGYLADVVVYRIVTTADISQVSVHSGDFAKKQLEIAVNTPQRNQIIAEKYLELGRGLPFLAFTVDVQHAHDLSDVFQRYGVHCVPLSGKTPLSERRRIIEEYQAGKIQGLASCAVLREGFDAPIATVGLMAAPTQSSLVYTQEVGRLLRPYPPPELRNNTGHSYVKESAIILDFCDFRGDRRVFNAATLFGLNADFDLKGQRARRVVEEIEKLELRYPSLDLRSAASLEDAEVLVERKDPFSTSGVTKVSTRLSRFAWLMQTEDTYRLAAGSGLVLWIEVDQLGQAKVYRREAPAYGRALVGEFEEIEEAFAYADSLVPVDRIGITLRTAYWRRQPPTENQCQLLWKLDPGIRQNYRTATEFYQFCLKKYHWSRKRECNRGALSERIDAIRSKREAY